MACLLFRYFAELTQFPEKVHFVWLAPVAGWPVSRDLTAEGSRPGAINALQRRIALGSNSTVNCIESYSEARETVEL